MDTTRDFAAWYDAIPRRTIESLIRYRDDRIPTGGFLEAVLSNDLKSACGRADEDNAAALKAIGMWCANQLPWSAWGSREAVAGWLYGDDDDE